MGAGCVAAATPAESELAACLIDKAKPLLLRPCAEAEKGLAVNVEPGRASAPALLL
jgi:hypothetical protein